jgi:hypothetical protein
MHFRMVSKVTELVIVPECEFPVDVSGSPGVVLIRRRMADGSRTGPNETETEDSLDSVALTEFEHEVPADLVGILITLSEGRVPAGFKPPRSWVTYHLGPSLHTEGFAIEGSMPALRWLPAEMQVILEGLEKAASEAARRVVDLIRLRVGKLAGSHSPITLELFEWSTDGSRWSTVPWDVEIHEDERLGVVLGPDQIRDVQAMANEQFDLPFAHVLLREAWELRTTNPRSSILLGIAGAEIGIKQAIQTLVPDASYLVEKLSMLPVVDLMHNYVPMLPVRLTFSGEEPSIPKWVRTVIGNGVEDRNKLAHRPLGGTEIAEKLEFGSLTRLLRAVHDLLMLLDYYCGSEWAADLLSGETRAAMQLPDLPPEEITYPGKFTSNRLGFSILIPDPDTN